MTFAHRWLQLIPILAPSWNCARNWLILFIYYESVYVKEISFHCDFNMFCFPYHISIE